MINTTIIEKYGKEACKRRADNKRRLGDIREQLERAHRRLQVVSRAQAVIREVALEVQSHAYDSIASVVTRCLRVVFGEEYAFVVEVKKVGGKSLVSFQLSKGGEFVDLMEASGGGVVDVVAFALRMSVIFLKHSKGRRFLVLDEPFKFLSAEHRSKVAVLLETLAKDMGVQILMITHADEFCVGRVVRI